MRVTTGSGRVLLVVQVFVSVMFITYISEAHDGMVYLTSVGGSLRNNGRKSVYATLRAVPVTPVEAASIRGAVSRTGLCNAVPPHVFIEDPVSAVGERVVLGADHAVHQLSGFGVTAEGGIVLLICIRGDHDGPGWVGRHQIVVDFVDLG